jgi:hypothetical protein
MNAKEIKLGLHIPLFSASLVAMLIGGPLLGLIAVWVFIIPGEVSPFFLRVLHAHVSWWAMVLLISSLIVPALSLKRQINKIITVGVFLILPLYVLFITLHNITTPSKLYLPLLGEVFVTPFGFVAGVIDIIFFGVAAVLALIAAGIRFPRLLSETDKPTRYEFVSDISVPRKLFGVYVIFLSLSVIIGFYLLAFFRLGHEPISPAALVQFHTHIGLFAIGFVMTLLVMRAIGAADSAWQLTYRIGMVALTATALGFLVFILFNTHSIVWVVPAMIYFGVLVLGFVSTLGKLGLRAIEDNYFHYTRWAIAIVWGLLLVLVLVGPHIALRYTTTPDLTVSFRQPDGGIDGRHIGPYADTRPGYYLGSAPLKGNPRALEKAHLSPGSWAHVAIFWLLILMVFGKQIFPTIGTPTFLFALASLIMLAPIMNTIGRTAAIAGLPGGMGALFYAGHPLKTLNTLALLIVMGVLMVKLRRQEIAANKNRGGPPL